MILTKIYTFTIAANASYNLPIVGKFFKIQSSTGPLDVIAPGFQLQNIGTGQGLQNEDFLGLELRNRSGASNTITIIVGDSNFIDSLNGTVAVTSNKNPILSPTFTAKTVTNASASLVAASSTRQYLLIQNKDATGNIYVSTNGTTTAANGVKIGPGESYEMPFGCALAITALGDIASNANIVVVEG